MRRIEKMPTPGSVLPGQTATVNLPLGPTYNTLMVNMNAAATGNSPVPVTIGTWGDYVNDIRLIVNGDTRIEISAADLVAMNQFYGQSLTPGVLPLFLSQPWMRTIAGEDNTSYGTAQGIASFTLEMDLKADIAVGLLEVYAVQSAPQPFGPHLRIQRFSDQMGLVGTKEISDLPLGGYNMLAMHLNTGNIDKVEILADNVKITETTDRLRDAHQRMVDRVPQNNFTHIDFLTENRLGESLYMGLTDFRAKLDFTAVTGSFRLYAVSIQGVA